MTNDVLSALTFLSALGSGLMSGIFFAFSVFVIKALTRLPAREGIAAMQSINVAVINPMFMTAFFGTAVAYALAVALSLLRWTDAGARYAIVGGALYLGGVVLVTIMANVPMNNALASLGTAYPRSAAPWAGYITKWTAWNHIRTAAAFAAAASLTIALCF